MLASFKSKIRNVFCPAIFLHFRMVCKENTIKKTWVEGDSSKKVNVQNVIERRYLIQKNRVHILQHRKEKAEVHKEQPARVWSSQFCCKYNFLYPSTFMNIEFVSGLICIPYWKAMSWIYAHQFSLSFGVHLRASVHKVRSCYDPFEYLSNGFISGETIELNLIF
jgi:hypothetical protein